MFKRMYTAFVDFSVKRPWWVLGGALVITLFFILQASHLKISMTWIDMMPQHEPMVREYQELIRMYGTTDLIMVAVETDSEPKTMVLAQEVAEAVRGLNKWVERVDYTIDTDFIKAHGFMLSKQKDIKRYQSILNNPNVLPWLTALNNDFEKEYIEDGGNLKKDETQAAAQINALGYFADVLVGLVKSDRMDQGAVAGAVDRLTVGDRYILSSDRKMAALIIKPTFTSDDTEKGAAGVAAIQVELDKLEKEHPGAWIAMTGMSVLAADEMKTAESDSSLITLGALIIITILFIVTFRMWTAPLLAMMVLVVGIVWDYGLANIILGKLTMFSAMSALLLIGLGVDYLMHFLSGFFDARVEGKDARESVLQVYRTSGRGIVAGGLTTAVVFFCQILSDFPAMVEFGITMGMGIITCMAVTLLVLPAIMILRERYLLKKAASGKTVTPHNTQFVFVNQFAKIAYTRPWLTLGILTATALLMGWGTTKVWFDENYLNSEAKGLESVKMYDILAERFDMSADGMVFSTASLSEAQNLAEKLDDLATVGHVESLTQYLPTEETQARRRPLVAAVHAALVKADYAPVGNREALAGQLERLSDNIIEMGQMGYLSGLTKITKQCDLITGLDQDGQQKNANRILAAARAVREMPAITLDRMARSFFTTMRENSLAMANTSPITLADIRPDIRERFISRDGKSYLVQVFSRTNVYKHLYDTTFIDDVHAVVPQATGMPGIFKRIINLAAEKGITAMKLATVIIVVLLLLTFKNVVYTILALLPMAVAYLFTFGTLGIINQPLTMVNVMMLPLILGIGIDDGIHLIHRYQIEGPGSQGRIIQSTGKAIFLTSATTVLGFGSLISAKYQGFGDMGWLTAIGISWCFVTSILLIPAVLRVLEKRK